jgi:hypothetical protein
MRRGEYPLLEAARSLSMEEMALQRTLFRQERGEGALSSPRSALVSCGFFDIDLSA